MDLFDIVAARAGGSGGGGAPQVQSDWEQNDSSKKDYIKNRTHWKEEIEREHFELPNTERDPRIDLTATGRKIGLVAGQEYNMEIHLVDGTVETHTVIPEELPASETANVEGTIGFILPTGTLIDGLVIDWDKGEAYLGNNAYYKIETSVISKIVILDTPNVETVYHKIPKEYYDIPIDFEYYEHSSNPQSGVAVREAIKKTVEPYFYKNRYLGEYTITTLQEVTSVNVSSLIVEELEKTFSMSCEMLYILVSFPDSVGFSTPVPLEVTIKQSQYGTTSEICQGNISYEGKSKTCLVAYEYLKDGKFISIVGDADGDLQERFSPVGIIFSTQIDRPTKEVIITFAGNNKIPEDTTIKVYGEVYSI